MQGLHATSIALFACLRLETVEPFPTLLMLSSRIKSVSALYIFVLLSKLSVSAALRPWSENRDALVSSSGNYFRGLTSPVSSLHEEASQRLERRAQPAEISRPRSAPARLLPFTQQEHPEPPPHTVGGILDQLPTRPASWPTDASTDALTGRPRSPLSQQRSLSREKGSGTPTTPQDEECIVCQEAVDENGCGIRKMPCCKTPIHPDVSRSLQTGSPRRLCRTLTGSWTNAFPVSS